MRLPLSRLLLRLLLMRLRLRLPPLLLLCSLNLLASLPGEPAGILLCKAAGGPATLSRLRRDQLGANLLFIISTAAPQATASQLHAGCERSVQHAAHLALLRPPTCFLCAGRRGGGVPCGGGGAG